MKVCKLCHQSKPLDSFHIAAQCKNGRHPRCNECRKESVRTKDGLAHCIYSSQKRSTKDRGYAPVAYTLEEFKVWLFTQPNFIALYEDWVLSKYATKKIPSTDRLDDYSGYTLAGIRLTTWETNERKGYEDRFKGINTKISKAVDQLDLSGNFLERYPSMCMAARSIGVLKSTGNISAVCHGKFLTAYGYKWRFSAITNNNMENT